MGLDSTTVAAVLLDAKGDQLGSKDGNVEAVPTPGEYLRQQLEDRGWVQEEFAEILGRDRKTVSELVRGARGITAAMARDLEAATGTPAKRWLELEAAHQLSQVDGSPDVAHRAQLYEKAPVREMVKRGWIEETDDSNELEQRLLRFFGMASLDDDPRFAAHRARKSTSYGEDMTPAQWAWLFRAKQLAEATRANNYTPRRFEEALGTLRQLLLSPTELRRVPGILAEGGVRLVIVQHLSGTKIDGACFWLNKKSPVVALSLRYDRIDYFWYTLLHELGHVSAEDGRGGEPLPLDVGFSDEPRDAIEASEKAADAFASAFLVDPAEIEDFILRVAPLYSPRRILGFSKRIKVHPGIVVGQLQHLNELSYKQYRSLLTKVRDTVINSALTDGWGFSPVLVP